MKRILHLVAAMGFAVVCLFSVPELLRAAPAPSPVIYSTDLMHPHDDPDDHFDLACLFALPEVDLRAVILDNGASQAERPGFKPVWQLNYLAGRHVPCAIGLSRKLKSPSDPALDQPAEFQNGVNLLLQTLRDSQEKVALIFVGSARDTVAAFNREPALFREKVRSIHGFIGEASDPKFIEYNVSLDPLAFAGLIRADLPFFWIPCFDGGLWQNHGHASYWKVTHRQVLAGAPQSLQRYFLYMLRRASSDPIEFLRLPTVPEEWDQLLHEQRNLWCGAFLGLSVGRTVQHGGRDVAGFEPIDVTVADTGVVSPGAGPGSHRVMRFVIHNREQFSSAATAATAEILSRFPIRRP